MGMTQTLFRSKNLIISTCILNFIFILLSTSVNEVDLPQLKGPSGEIILGLGTLLDVDYSYDGRYVATCGSIGAFLWDMESGKLLCSLDDHSLSAGSVKFSSQGRLLLAANYSREVRIYDVASHAAVGIIRDPSEIMTSEFSQDGKVVIVASSSGIVKVWDIGTMNVVREFMTVQPPLYSVFFSPDRTKMASVEFWEDIFQEEYSGTIKIWDLESGALLNIIVVHHIVYRGFFSPDGNSLLIEAGAAAHEMTTSTLR